MLALAVACHVPFPPSPSRRTKMSLKRGVNHDMMPGSIAGGGGAASKMARRVAPSSIPSPHEEPRSSAPAPATEMILEDKKSAASTSPVQPQQLFGEPASPQAKASECALACEHRFDHPDSSAQDLAEAAAAPLTDHRLLEAVIDSDSDSAGSAAEAGGRGVVDDGAPPLPPAFDDDGAEDGRGRVEGGGGGPRYDVDALRAAHEEMRCGWVVLID